jgi:hypothetical protein
MKDLIKQLIDRIIFPKISPAGGCAKINAGTGFGLQ